MEGGKFKWTSQVLPTWAEFFFSRGITVAAGLVTNKSQSPLIGLSLLLHLVKFIRCCAVAQHPPPLSLSLFLFPLSPPLPYEGKQIKTLAPPCGLECSATQNQDQSAFELFLTEELENIWLFFFKWRFIWSFIFILPLGIISFLALFVYYRLELHHPDSVSIETMWLACVCGTQMEC